MSSKWFAPVLIGLTLLFGVVVYPQLPDQVPSHWSLSGEINGTQPKAVAVLLVPVLMLIVWAATRVGYGFHLFGRQIESVPARLALVNVTLLFLGVIQVLALGTSLGWQIAMPRVIMVMLGLLLTLMGNQMRRLKPNFFIGIRTPWTLTNPDVWRRTHAYGGKFYFALGLLIVILALLLPPAESGVIGITLILLSSAWIIYYSFRISRTISQEVHS